MKSCKPLNWPGTPASEVSRPSAEPMIPSREGRRSKTLMLLTLGATALALLAPSYGQATKVFSCSEFASSGACGVSIMSNGDAFKVTGTENGSTPSFTGSQVILVPGGSSHTGLNLNYQKAAVNVQAFTTTYTYVPNGNNIGLILNNTTNNPSGFNGANFAGGAGCEGSIFQGFSLNAPPNAIFAVQLDQMSPLTDANGSGYGTPFTYSSTQVYQAYQDVCNPADGGEKWYYFTRKISTSPVPLNSPSSTAGTTTGHTYSVTVTFNGNNVTEQLYDVTAGGSCPSSSCFTQTWNNMSVPAMVGSTTAWVGLGESTYDTGPSVPLYVSSFSYSTLSSAATPTISPSGNSYSSAQSVTISDSSSGSIICYNTTGNPSTNGVGGCVNGTLYSGAVSVSKGETIYAVAGSGTSSYGDSAVTSAAFNISGTASQPVFSASGGEYQGVQTLVLTAAQGSVICYNTTGSPATNGSTGCSTGTLYSTPITVSSNETIYAVAGGSGLADSGVGSVNYVISPYWGGFPDSALPPSSPTFSPLPGTYSGTQSVTLSTTSGAYICYALSATPLAVPPYPDSAGGCQNGTLYTGPVSVQSTEFLYAVAGVVATTAGGPSTVPSSLVTGSYTIGGDSDKPAPPTNGQATVVLQ